MKKNTIIDFFNKKFTLPAAAIEDIAQYLSQSYPEITSLKIDEGFISVYVTCYLPKKKTLDFSPMFYLLHNAWYKCAYCSKVSKHTLNNFVIYIPKDGFNQPFELCNDCVSNAKLQYFTYAVQKYTQDEIAFDSIFNHDLRILKDGINWNTYEYEKNNVG